MLITSESVQSDSFADFVNELRARERLNRIIVDECHVVLNDQPNFRPCLRNLHTLNRIKTSMLLLTATLPPVKEARFLRRM